jgi:hypothetical protein
MNELNFEEQIENKLEVNSNRNVTRNYLNSTGRNFLIWDQNPVFYQPLERLQNSLGFWYSRFPQDPFGSRLKVQICSDSSVWLELTPPPTFSDHNSWTVGRMRVYLCFLERSQNSLSLSYCALSLILYQSQSAEFCEFVSVENRIWVNALTSWWFSLEFWFVVSVQWIARIRWQKRSQHTFLSF